ncbi:motility associated factor glycosyltransferase family protein [Paenibacillus rhizovicinus]|uniref:Motility associated factor glycosyltransferase family protein n=1 Tax=Paenibacillus rhizovicinus TaxID=2704463 RepID=A0A6C0P442_9BACL|nr:6-hydroxymethylpterin diphosphokinase MptE-like protein [Paenibacillus rhizovicinus]QHW32603.1 motility associated factor glycosyltransferase family protein [Paenibacillus rhizovicinus]
MQHETISFESVLEDVKDFLPRLIGACGSVSELFYVPVTEQTWTEFSEFLEGTNDLYKTVVWLRSELEPRANIDVFYTVIAGFADQLAYKFSEMNRLMDEEQYVHAADYLKYELLGLFQAFAMKLGEKQEIIALRVEKNMAYLKEHYPNVYDQLHNIQLDHMNYQITYASNGSPNLYIRTDDNRSLYMYSNYVPEYEAAQWVESQRDAMVDKTNIIVYGIGLGYHLSELARKYPLYNFFIYEPDEQVLLATVQAIDLEQLFSQLKIDWFFIGDNKMQRHRVFFQFANLAKGDTAILSLPVYDKLNAAMKLTFFEDAKVAIKHYGMSARTMAYYGIQIYQNRMYNMSHLINTPSIMGMKNKLKGSKAVIVGAGPSLEKDIELLRKLKDHAFIIAAGSAIQSLMHFGITPHLVVTLDYSEANNRAFSHMDIDDVPILYSPQLKYKILDHKKKLMHFLMRNDYEAYYHLACESDEPLFSTTPSVTGPTVEAMIYMGCDEIVFTGQDFSYPSEHMYAAGAKHVDEEQNHTIISGAKLEIENVRGGMNRTNDMMQVTLGEIEKVLESNSHIKFTNSSQVGAKIKHTEWESMESVLRRLGGEKLPSDAFDKAMQEHLRPYDAKRKSVIYDRLIRTPDELEHIETTLRKIDRKLRALPALSRVKPQKCHKEMIDIEVMWGTVVHTKVFEYALGATLSNEIRNFDRDVKEVVEEINLVRKADLFCQVLGAISKAIVEMLPTMKGIVAESIRRTDEQYVPG